MAKFQIVEKHVVDSYVYDVVKNGKVILPNLRYNSALEDVDSLMECGDEVEMVYLNGDRSSFESELQAKRIMDARGWR